ncbi:MAG: glycerol-3-phosphate 1-O-acyltransferase PlsY [Alphaproteobacteria bacterium]|nr:glycerol-3-phosphate 1-O-acyltransferase PlsY [Alphaproteobacteria bacterium]
MVNRFTQSQLWINPERVMMTDQILLFSALSVAAYLLGSVPFGLIFTKISGRGDIRGIGSGNIGATNVLRTGSRKLAGLTLIFDAGKGAVAVAVAGHFAGSQMAAVAGLLVVAGHCFPIWLKFVGGKGVATSLAVFATLDLRLGGLFVLVWLVTAWLSRFSSLAALCAVLAVTTGSFFLLDDGVTQIIILLLSTLVWTRHHANIGRLLNGTETKIGAK